MSPVHYEELRYKSTLNRVEGMGFRWSLNPYRGCVHGCHYCFARRYHFPLDLNPSEDFTGIIFVKVNAPEMLRLELSAPSWHRETVAVGTATDPYQPIEGKYRITRGCLEAFCDYRSPISLVTKGTMVVRDADVLAELARRAGATICFSVTTLYADLWRKLEPGTPPPWKRLVAMERLVQAGVTAGVLLAPVIPGITDRRGDLEAVVRAASEHGACFLGTNTLYLKPGTREHFLGFLEREYPGLLATYRRLYPGNFAPKRFQQLVQAQVAGLKRDYGLQEWPRPVSPQQLKLALSP
ncbi:MAG: radical SAM protein [Dehalococcoidia bacterium]